MLSKASVVGVKRSPLPRGRPPRRVTPLRARSAKRRSEERERIDVRARVIERDGGCALRTIGGCEGSLDVDEIIPRGRGGDWLDDANCQALCHRHHMLKHARPHVASIIGLYGLDMQMKHVIAEIGTLADPNRKHALIVRAFDDFNA